MVSGENSGKLRHKPRHKPAALPAKGPKWLVLGEYTMHGRDRLAARWWLIQAVAREVPRLLESLRDNVYPRFAALDIPTERPAWRFADLECWAREVKGVRKNKRVRLLAAQESQRSFCGFLLAWATGFHITTNDAWILDGVVRILASWRRVPEMRTRPDYGGADLLRAAFAPPPAESGFVPGARPFRPRFPGWDPIWISFEGWSKIMRDRFDKALSAYEVRMRKQAEAAGYVKMAGRASEDHFTWLALYQFAGFTYERIHRRYPTRVNDRTAIQKGVARAAQLAGITLRTRRL